MNEAPHSGDGDQPLGVSGRARPGSDDQETGAHRGWHSRGYLPHFDGSEVIQHVTFHLADSLPKIVIARIEHELRTFPLKRRDIQRRKKIEEWIDAGHGSCILRVPAIAAMVQGAFLHFDRRRYHLLAWVVMPNHVHVLTRPINGWSIAKIVASWKKFSARRIGDYRRERDVPIWHREYWDRYMRDEAHLLQAIEYIHQNPVKAGLIARAEEWRWSSAYPGNADL